MLKIWNVLEP